MSPGAGYGRHGTAYPVCVTSVSPHTHRLNARMLLGFVARSGHSGHALATDLLRAVSEHPAGLDIPTLQATLSLFVGDGAMVQGGPQRSKAGTGMGDIMWRTVHPAPEQQDPDMLPLAALAQPRAAHVRAGIVHRAGQVPQTGHRCRPRWGFSV